MREKLFNKIEEVFSEGGYNFYRGFAYQMNAQELKFPCVWLNPIKLRGIRGVREVVGQYHISLYLVAREDSYTEQIKEQVWGELERKAIESYQKIMLERVITVSDLECYPDEFSQSKYGTLSMRVSFTAELSNCVDKREGTR